MGLCAAFLQSPSEPSKSAVEKATCSDHVYGRQGGKCRLFVYSQRQFIRGQPSRRRVYRTIFHRPGRLGALGSSAPDAAVAAEEDLIT